MQLHDSDEDLHLALALSLSESEAAARPSRTPPTSALGAPSRLAAGSQEPGAGVGKQLGRLADSFLRFVGAGQQAGPTAPRAPPPQEQPGFSPPATSSGGYRGGGLHVAAPPSSDEDLARALQAQYDQEAAEQQAREWEQGAGQQQQQRRRPETGPTAGHPPPGPLASAAGGARHGALPPPAPAGCCAGCRQPLGGVGSLFGGGGHYINALGRRWHHRCFVCAACKQPVPAGVSFAVGKDGLPYHPACYRDCFHPRCAVCSDFVPTRGDGQIVWTEDPFWRGKWCPDHNSDGTKRCTGCTRMQPRGTAWADLDDGRALCLDCLHTLVADTADCQPLYDDILRFYARMGMPLPGGVRPPMMLVPSDALNQAERSETHGAGRQGPVFHTRGLCLTEEYTSFRTVMRAPGGGGGMLGALLSGGGFALQPQTVQLGPTHTEVTAILVLYGLPYLLTGTILAHECMHAWLRLSGYRSLPQEVEEGMCQGSFEERLASFLAHQIRTDPSYVYGDGFRAALECYQRFGLQTMLAHLRAAGRLPE